ncbi:MAG: hypothetical protein ACTSV7_15090 [Candidatus Baldrarchaeia archaeon]
MDFLLGGLYAIRIDWMEDEDKRKLTEILEKHGIDYEHEGQFYKGIGIYTPFELLPQEAQKILEKYL